MKTKLKDLQLPEICGAYITGDSMKIIGNPSPEFYGKVFHRHMELRKEYIGAKVESEIKMAEINCKYGKGRQKFLGIF